MKYNSGSTKMRPFKLLSKNTAFSRQSIRRSLLNFTPKYKSQTLQADFALLTCCFPLKYKAFKILYPGFYTLIKGKTGCRCVTQKQPVFKV
ncbi:hypothetical protein DP923_04065 [Pontibacter arcticus]|uniref:Uncharacterized protein n=1 Tax=Pontibacter arcticus TaxID=2080288 RepID=A0A364RJ26_9BACT|nr:hypothetical protein DP923_04065 [Pontibacter arcticus]